MGWGKYGSIECRSKAQRIGKQVACSTCDKSIYRTPKNFKHSKSKKFFCNKTCQTKWRNSYFIEEKHHNWLGGVRAYRKILDRTGRRKVCKMCLQTDTRVLIAHHIDHDRKNNLPNNLVWLCLNCHHLTHNYEPAELKLFKLLQN